ncbi:hypothetical protein C7U61_14565 [Rhizobium sp. JAB6]|uniref:hypothetical protein n=1 Tax=Rhizobium sp. JAB6 TaxID=2127050 RepID=UPI000D11A58F|nr:hypothetical protein [Rhizobium sp. JAB6]PST19713.1 hypothetical protein C7U61_14565 [Rhizobium sp. JAB6]
MSQTSLRLRVVPRYPAKVTATDGLKAVRTGVDLVVKSDYSNLVQVPTVTNPDRTFMLAWDSDLDNYQSMSFTNIINNIQDAVIGPPLAAIDATNPGANQAVYFTGVGVAATYTISPFVRGISNAPDQGSFVTAAGAATASQGAKADSALQASTLTIPGNRTFGDFAFKKADQIYGAVYPDITVDGGFFDQTSTILHIPSSDSLVNNYGATSSYIWNESGSNQSSTHAGNGVNFFGVQILGAAHSAAWGLNTLLQDAPTRAVSTQAGGILIGAEFDSNVMSPLTQVIGVSVGGNGLRQPASANAFIANSLGTIDAGGITPIRWETAFISFNGCAQRILFGGSASLTANSDSQLITLRALDASRNPIDTNIYNSGGFLVADTVNGLAVRNGGIFLDAGKTLLIGGVGVIGSRKTGWAADTGTAKRSANTTYSATAEAAYTQATIQTLMNTVRDLSQTIKALKDDMIAHGLIGA